MVIFAILNASQLFKNLTCISFYNMPWYALHCYHMNFTHILRSKMMIYLIKNKILNDEFYLNWELMIELKNYDMSKSYCMDG